MRIIVAYVFPNIGDEHYVNLALRFLRTYHEFPAGVPHESVVICNGHKPTAETEFVFGALENCKVIPHDNCGKDCSAYQLAAWENPTADMMVFFGASTYIKGRNWLARMSQARQKRGDTLYGTTANRGNLGCGVYPHLRTTGFWCSPKLMNDHPLRVTDPSHRYPFEHGPDCLTEFAKKRGLTPWLVSWDGEHQEHNWDSVKNGYHNGNQSNLLVGDRITEPPFYPHP